MDMQQAARNTAQRFDQSSSVGFAAMDFENDFMRAVEPTVLADHANGKLPTDQEGMLKYLNEQRSIYAKMVSGFDNTALGINIAIKPAANGEPEQIVFSSAK